MSWLPSLAVDVDPVTRAELDRQWRVVQEWLVGADARAAATAELQGLRARGLDADDLLADAALRLWRTLRDRPAPVDEGPDGHGLVRYARRAVRNAAVDAFRALARRPEVPVEAVGDRPGDDVALVVPEAGGWLDGARRALHADLAVASTPAAAALVAVTVLADEATLAADVPQPQRGATPAQAAAWAGLWFVGGDALFPADDDTASRQRRSRATRQVDHHLRAAVVAAADTGGDHG